MQLAVTVEDSDCFSTRITNLPVITSFNVYNVLLLAATDWISVLLDVSYLRQYTHKSEKLICNSTASLLSMKCLKNEKRKDYQFTFLRTFTVLYIIHKENFPAKCRTR